MTKVMKALGGSEAVMENRKTDISYLQNLFTLTRKKKKFLKNKSHALN